MAEDLNIKMVLTLTDVASGPIIAFIERLEKLKVSSVGVGKNLERIALGINSVNEAASKSSIGLSVFAQSLTMVGAALDVVKASSTGVATAVGNIGNKASSSGVGIYALEQAMASLGGTLSKVQASLAGTGVALAEISGAAKAASAGLSLGSAQMATGLSDANSQASSLRQTLKGVAEIWGALEIKKGIIDAGRQAVNYETTQTRLLNMKVTPDENAGLIGAANAASVAIPQFNKNETLEMGIDLRNATGSVSEAIHMLTPFAQAAFNMKMATPEGKVFDMNSMLLIAKALEQRNATQDPNKMQAELDMFSKIYAATQGRVDANQILGNLQYSKGGLGQTFDIGFMPIFASMIEQIKSQGGQGGAIGTMLTTLQSDLMGRGNNESQRERARLGLIAEPKWTSQGNVNRSKSDLTVVGIDEFQRNPYEWVQNILKPAMIRAGIDLTDDAAVNRTLNKLFPDRQAAQPLSMMITRGQLLEKDATNVNQAGTNLEQYQNNIKTAKANLKAFSAQVDNLAIVMGTTLLPTITAVAAGLTSLVQGLSAFFTEHPVVAELTLWAAAFVSVGLAIAGMSSLFGIASGGIIKMLGSMTGILAIPVWMSTAGAAVTTFVGVIGVLFGAILRIGLSWEAGFKIGELIRGWMENNHAEFTAGLDRMITTAIGWADRFVTTIENAWIRSKQFFGMMSKAQADAAVSANNAGVEARFATNVTDPAKEAAYKYLHPINPWPINPNYGNEGHGGAAANNPDYGHEGNRSVARVKARLFGSSVPPESVPKSSRGSRYNADADLAANQFKQEEDQLRTSIRILNSLYKEGLLSVEVYYSDKQVALETAVEAELIALNKERAAFEKAKNQAGVNRIDTQIAAVKNKLESGTDQNESDKKAALNKLDRDAIDIQRQLLQTSSQRHAAELLHIQEELKAKLDILVLNGRITKEEADTAMARSKAAVEYQQQKIEINQIQTVYADKISEINDLERNGQLSHSAAEDRKIALMKQEARELDILIAKLRELAVASGNDQAVIDLDKLSTKNATVEAMVSPDQIQYMKAVEDGFGNIFKKVLSGSESGKHAIQDFAQSMNNTLLDIISKRLGDMLYDSLFGGLFGDNSGGGGGGGGKRSNGIGSVLQNLFGSGDNSRSGGSSSGGGGNNYGLLGQLGKSFMGSSMGQGLSSWASSLFGSSGVSAASLSYGALENAAADSTLSSLFIDYGAFLDTGTDYVPSDMVAMIHKGERVMPASDNAAFTTAAQIAAQGGSNGGSNMRPIEIHQHFSPGTNSQTTAQAAVQAGRVIQRHTARGNA